MEIRKLSIEEMYASIPFVCKVFDKYEAVNYPEDGKNAFKQAISSKEYLEMLSAYGAFLDEKLIGIIATRNQGTHVALFFVDGQYHKQGIGRSLFEAILKDCDSKKLTVNSSEYAIEVYKKLGFEPTADIQMEDGIRFLPMEYIK